MRLRHTTRRHRDSGTPPDTGACSHAPSPPRPPASGEWERAQTPESPVREAPAHGQHTWCVVWWNLWGAKPHTVAAVAGRPLHTCATTTCCRAKVFMFVPCATTLDVEAWRAGPPHSIGGRRVALPALGAVTCGVIYTRWRVHCVAAFIGPAWGHGAGASSARRKRAEPYCCRARRGAPPLRPQSVKYLVSLVHEEGLFN